MLNRIVTNGFGRSRSLAGVAGPVTMGYGGVTRPSPVSSGVPRRARGDGIKDRDTGKRDVLVWARLLLLKGMSPVAEVKGYVKVPELESGTFKAIVEHVDTRKKQDVHVVAVRTSRRRRRP